jgi:uncharacterized membrane protein
MVRPLIAPMAEGAAETRYPALTDALRYRIRAMAAATDNVGLFFGEDVFVAFGAIVLMQTILRGEGLEVDPLHMALWGIPTAVTAFIIHAWRLRRLDAQIAAAMALHAQALATTLPAAAPAVAPVVGPAADDGTAA